MIGGETNTCHVSALPCTHVVPEIRASLLQLQDHAVRCEFMTLGRFLQSKLVYFVTTILRLTLPMY